MITFDGVSKRYLTQQALRDVSVIIPIGKIIGVVGPNGSGKSTFLKLIAGLVKPSSGTLTMRDEVITRRSSKDVAYLSELDAYYSFYTVGETIDYFATQFPDLDRKKAQEIMEYMKLDPLKKVKHLSKGNRGRLKIVLTLARNVPIILMDEPLSGLDPMVRDSIVRGLISFIDLEKQSVIITTHEVSEIEPILDIVMAIRDGELIKVSEVDELRQEENMSIVDWMKKVYG